MKIVLVEPLGISSELLEKYAGEIRGLGHEFVSYAARPADTAELCARVEGADAVMVANLPFPKEAVGASGNLKYIDIAFTGVDHVDIAACKERGISVSTATSE